MAVNLILENRTQRIANIAGPSSYATGGDAFTPGDFALSRLDALIVSSATASGYVVAPNPATSKLVWYKPDSSNGLVEVTAATNLSGEVLSVVAYGLP